MSMGRGPAIPKPSMPDDEKGMLEFEESRRFTLSLGAILVFVALVIAFIAVLWFF